MRTIDFQINSHFDLTTFYHFSWCQEVFGLSIAQGDHDRESPSNIRHPRIRRKSLAGGHILNCRENRSQSEASSKTRELRNFAKSLRSSFRECLIRQLARTSIKTSHLECTTKLPCLYRPRTVICKVSFTWLPCSACFGQNSAIAPSSKSQVTWFAFRPTFNQSELGHLFWRHESDLICTPDQNMASWTHFGRNIVLNRSKYRLVGKVILNRDSITSI